MSVPLSLNADQADALFTRLQQCYGAQHWWPADSRFEIMVGAVLTQNASWHNVKRALERLREANVLDAEKLVRQPLDHVADLLRPVGYFNLKARRLLNFVRWYCDNGGYEDLQHLETSALREALLGLNGIGPETADDMLLYAFERPVFVIDAYTRRLFSRLGLLPVEAPYETIRAAFEAAISPDPVRYGEYHALIVAHAKTLCRPYPACTRCSLRPDCPGRKS